MVSAQSKRNGAAERHDKVQGERIRSRCSLADCWRTGMYTLKGGEKGLAASENELADRPRNSSTTSWNCTTTQSERSQISDGTSFFCSYAIGLRGSLSGWYMRGAGPCLEMLWF